jgi:ABC-2 type transport system ATP-binding protein
MFEVEEMCDQVLIMSYGHVADSGAPAELIERYECESLDEVFMTIAEQANGEEWYDDEGEEGEAVKPEGATPAKT